MVDGTEKKHGLDVKRDRVIRLTQSSNKEEKVLSLASSYPERANQAIFPIDHFRIVVDRLVQLEDVEGMVQPKSILKTLKRAELKHELSFALQQFLQGLDIFGKRLQDAGVLGEILEKIGIAGVMVWDLLDNVLVTKENEEKVSTKTLEATKELLSTWRSQTFPSLLCGIIEQHEEAMAPSMTKGKIRKQIQDVHETESQDDSVTDLLAIRPTIHEPTKDLRSIMLKAMTDSSKWVLHLLVDYRYDEEFMRNFQNKGLVRK